MGLEKLDTRLGFCIGRGEDIVFPVLVRVKKPTGEKAKEALGNLGVAEQEIAEGRFVFSLNLGTEKIKELAEEPWVVKIIMRTPKPD